MTHHTFLVGDVRDALATLADESVHCVVSSPPYFGLRSYLPDGHPDKVLEIGLEESLDEYIETMVEVFRQVRRVLRKDGTVWANWGDSYAGSGRGVNADGSIAAGPKQKTNTGTTLGAIKKAGTPTGTKPKDLMMVPARVALALQADGWWLRSDIIFAKKAPMPESCTDRPTASHEHIFLLTKSQRYWYDAFAVAEPGVSGDPNPPMGSASLRQGTMEQHPHSLARKKQKVPSGWDTGEGAHGAFHRDGRAQVAEYREPKGDPSGMTRNMRDVWLLGPENFPDAHFATFPTEIPRRAIRAGCPEQVCAQCGAPWTRIVARSALSARSDAGRTHSTTEQRQGKTPVHEKGWESDRQDMGLRPTCNCNADTVPGTVLDPFGGSGTVSLVAKQLGRSSVYIDLSRPYCDMAVKRCCFAQQTLHVHHTHEVREIGREEAGK